MAALDITYVGNGGWAAGGASPVPTYPTGLAEGDKLYALVHSREGGTALPSTVATIFTKTYESDIGSGTVGAGTGPTRFTVYEADVPSGGLSGTVTFASLGTTAALACIHAFRAPSGATGLTWSEAFAIYSHTSSTSIGGTTSTSIALAAKDVCLVGIGSPDDTTTSLPLSTIAATGITFDTITTAGATTISGTGNDHAAASYVVPVSAGSATVAVTLTGTANAAETGGAMVLRIRLDGTAAGGGGGSDLDDPVIVQTGSFKATTGQMTQATAPVTISAATAGNVLCYCLAGDKNTGTLTVADNIGTGGGTNPWTVERSVTGASTCVYIAWKVALGGETTITGTVSTAPTSGNNAVCLEISQSGSPAWGVCAEASTAYSDSLVSARSTGTTGAATYKGLAVAAVSVDSHLNATAGSWSNGYSSAYAPSGDVGDGGGAPCYVATLVVAKDATTETTWTKSAGLNTDQMAGAVVVLGRQGLGAGVTDATPFFLAAA